VIVRCFAIIAVRWNCCPSLFILSLGGGVSELSCEVIVRFVDICTHVIVAINLIACVPRVWKIVGSRPDRSGQNKDYTICIC
jgi:hypothetical protein